jgi:hypothetical protein
MDEPQRLSIFQSQTQNLRALHQAWKTVNRQINESILRNNNTALSINTKILAVVYCGIAEITFSKLIHTPHGLTLDEIAQIKTVVSSHGVRNGWVKCSELAVQRVDGAKHNHPQNVRQKLEELIEEYIHDPSEIRNRLAHGQWDIALNNKNTAVNRDLTLKIESCDIIELYRRRYALHNLSAVIEDLIESPNRAHRRDYWKHIADLEAKQEELSAWTIERKTAQLRAKKSRPRHD